MRESELFERTADLIEEVGHCRGVPTRIEDGHCTISGMYAVAGPEQVEVTLPGDSALIDLVSRAGGRLSRKIGPFDLISSWSDHSPTQVVLDTLRRCAKDARLEEEAIGADDA